MRVTISDAFLLLDLFSLNLIDHFFSLDLEFFMCSEILNELSIAEKGTIDALCHVDKINIYRCIEGDWQLIAQKKYPQAIAQNDRISLYISQKFETLLLTTDDVVRKVAKKYGITYHGILWIFQLLIDGNKIKKEGAIERLNLLIKSNRFYQQNADFAAEMQKKIISWK